MNTKLTLLLILALQSFASAQTATPVDRFRRFDANSDGKLSRQEIPQRSDSFDRGINCRLLPAGKQKSVKNADHSGVLAGVAVSVHMSPSADTHQKGATSPTLRVATAQLPVTRDISENAAAIYRAMDVAVREGADILLTPEGSLSGYAPNFDQPEVENRLAGILKRASSARLALALGTCYIEPDDRKCYNEIRFYDADGTFLGFHTKTLLCGSLTDPPNGEINHYSTRPLRTFQVKGIRIGGLICNDMWGNPQCTPMPDPHLSQRLSESGARIIFLAINGGRNGSAWSEQVNWPYHETNMRMRAVAGKVWVVSADNCFPTNIPCSAPTGVLQPDGNWAAKAPRQGEHVVVHTIRLH